MLSDVAVDGLDVGLDGFKIVTYVREEGKKLMRIFRYSDPCWNWSLHQTGYPIRYGTGDYETSQQARQALIEAGHIDG